MTLGAGKGNRAFPQFLDLKKKKKHAILIFKKEKCSIFIKRFHQSFVLTLQPDFNHNENNCAKYS